jgi:hypothetical protein
VTGNSNLGAEVAAKSVELILEIVPSAKQIVVLANALDPFFELFVKLIQRAGETTGTAIDPVMIHNAEELDVAFRAMEKQRPDAVMVQPSLPTKRVAELALSHRIPSASTISRSALHKSGSHATLSAGGRWIRTAGSGSQIAGAGDLKKARTGALRMPGSLERARRVPQRRGLQG